MAKKKTKKKTTKSPKEKAPLQEPAKITPHPTAGPKVDEFEQKLDQQLADAKEIGKRGPGRPRKQPESEPEFELDLKTIAQGLKMPFDLWAVSQKIEQLRVTDDEACAIAIPAKKLLDYYFPGAPVIAIAWAGLVISLYTITAPRLKLIADLKKQKETSSATSAGQMDQGQGGPDQPVSNENQPVARIQFPQATKPVEL
ncbi:MAG: hypothetical protein FVQ80_15220 [Planctomycetes bacterium]|nr:hypothetical protein [Planctomycetota bacterium]